MKLFRKYKKRYNRKTDFLYLFLIGIVGVMGLGYATLTQGLSVSGKSTLKNATWDVHFENVQPVSGSVPADEEPTITDNTKVDFAASLINPSEFYSFTVDVVNDGSIDAEISSFSILPELSEEQSEWLTYKITYEDDSPIENGQVLSSGDTKTIKVYFECKDLLEEDQNLSISFNVNYIQSN